MGKLMQQQVKRQSTAEVEVEEVPTEINEQSVEASEDACCVLAEIDELLKEIDEPEEWDAETAPKPDWDREYLERYGEAQTWAERGALVEEYRTRMQEWHDVRGLSYRACTC